MSFRNYGLAFCILTLSGCSGNKEEVATSKAEPKIAERLSDIMTDLQQTEKIYLDASTSGRSYLILDKDELSSGMDWLGYALIEGINDNGEYSIATNYFVKDDKQPVLSVRLLNESPILSWSFEKGTNLNADLGKAISGSVDFKDSYIYEFVISKIADFSVEKSAFDDKKFNSTIFSLYVLSLSKDQIPTPAGYDGFKKAYGVARGGTLYDVIINEYKSTSIDGEGDIVGLVKAKGGFFEKTGKSGKKTIFKLFYANAGYIDNENFKLAAEKVRATMKAVNQQEVTKLIRDPTATVSKTAQKAAHKVSLSVAKALYSPSTKLKTCTGIRASRMTRDDFKKAALDEAIADKLCTESVKGVPENYESYQNKYKKYDDGSITFDISNKYNDIDIWCNCHPE